MFTIISDTIENEIDYNNLMTFSRKQMLIN